jgi:hypothetical protein
MGDRVGLEGDAYLFAVRLDDHGTDPGINFVIPGAVRTAPTQTLLNDRGLAELVTVACVIPGGPEATAFKVALSQGAWQSVDLPVLEGAHWGADTLGILHEDKPVLCKAEQVAEGLELTVVRHHLLTSEYDTRIVVVDRDGRERTPTKISSSGHQGLSLTTALFRGVAKADVKHAVLKYRPWNVVEFHNVSLKPGVKTEVQIVMPEAHAAAEPAHAAPEGRTGFGFPGGGGAPGGTPGVRRGGGFPGALPGLGGFGPPPEGAADVPKGAAALDAYPHKVMFISTGLTHFEPGDRIEITEVRGRKATLEQGGTYLIKGRYTLASRDEAVVGVSIATATDPREGRTIVHPGQQTKVQRGSGEFALVKTVETSGGWPHVSFSPAEGGSSFGNIYFGHGPEGLWLFPVLLEDPWVIRDAKASARAAEPGAVNSEKLPLAHQPPVVVKTSPEAGDQEVDPSITEIRVTYSKRMMDKSWSWSTDTGLGEFPEIDGQIRYLEDGRTCVMPVKLKPGTTYAIRLNSAKFHNFKDAENRPAVPYLLTFKTRN